LLLSQFYLGYMTAPGMTMKGRDRTRNVLDSFKINGINSNKQEQNAHLIKRVNSSVDVC
jgi:hypothetical protein